jgi:hypothetical protein
MKYLLVLQIIEGEQQGTPTPEQLAARMEPWNQYTQALIDAGVFVAGEGLAPSSTATTVRHEAGGEHIVTDGPFAETKEQIGGFYLLDCKDLDEVLVWAKRCPVGDGSSIEVRPIMDYADSGYDELVASASANG